MVKKRIKKKSVNKSFSNLNFQNKIIAVVLIVLAIGIIASVFPGEGMTGMTAAFEESFNLLKDFLKGVNEIILTIFKTVFGREKMLYGKIAFFGIAFLLVYSAMNIISDYKFLNLGLGILMAYLSTFLIPEDLISFTAFFYTSTFALMIFLAPLALLFISFFTLPKTKESYIKRAIMSIIIMIAIAISNFFLKPIYNPSLKTIISIIFVIAITLAVYSLIKYATFTEKAAEQRASEKVENAVVNRLVQLIARRRK